MKFNTAVLSTLESIEEHESEINRLSNNRTIFSFDRGSNIHIKADPLYRYILMFDGANIDEGLVGDGNVSTNDNLINEVVIMNQDIIVERYLIDRAYASSFLGTISSANKITTDRMTVSATIGSTWEGKISIAKRMIESRLNVLLKVYRSSANPNPVALINNAEVLCLASDFLTLHLIFKDLGLGSNSNYGSKSDLYYECFQVEFNNVSKAIDLDLTNNEKTSVHGFARDNLLVRRTPGRW